MTPELRVGDRVRYCKAWLDDLVMSATTVLQRAAYLSMSDRVATVHSFMSFLGTPGVCVRWDGLRVPCYLTLSSLVRLPGQGA